MIWALILGIEMVPGPAAPSLSLFLRESGVTFPVRHSLLFPDAKSFDTVCEAILKILKEASSQNEVSDMRALGVAPPSRSGGSVTNNSAAVTTNTTAVTTAVTANTTAAAKRTAGQKRRLWDAITNPVQGDRTATVVHRP